MHLQQTKRESRETGGPQYYFHDLTPGVKKHLRTKGTVPVALVTPYGATKSDYVAVATDRKLKAGVLVPGSVGHDRIQQGSAGESIGESIRRWFMLPQGDFERIDVDIELRDDCFYIKPLGSRYARSKIVKKIPNVKNPLTFTREYRSPLWLNQIRRVASKRSGIVWWCIEDIRRIARDHAKATKLPHIQETDILRAAGALRHLGMTLGGYVGKGYDCRTEFRFLEYPPYSLPVELKRNSLGFQYQQRKYGRDELSRAVVLCATHGHKNIPPHIDVLELEALAELRPEDVMERG